ncbi:hypothetical protein ACHAXT_001241 [Thalassiosira profunda]
MADPPAPHAGAMAYVGPAPDDHELTASADALTKRLYLTVMDVFGNYAPDDDVEYARMLDTLKQKKLPKAVCPTPKANRDNRGIVAKRLMEGYTLRDEVCDACVMPLMENEGEVSCVVCRKVEYESDEEGSVGSDVALALAATTGSEGTAEEREAMVEKELREANERRARATAVYASKLGEGYAMLDHKLCVECDMPMMQREEFVECVFCPKEEEKAAETARSVEAKEAQDAEAAAAAKPAEVSKSVIKLSQAEAIAARLETPEAGLDRAEGALLNTMEALGITSPRSRDFFAAKKRLREAEGGLREAEELAAVDETLTLESLTMEAAPAKDVEEPADANDEGCDANVAYAVAHTPRAAQGCAVVSALFPRLTRLFARTAGSPMGASRPIVLDDAPAKSMEYGGSAGSEAKAAAAALVEEGWAVSQENCARCALPLFAKGQATRCAVCGPACGTGTISAPHQSVQYAPKEGRHNAVANEMANRLMRGWTLVEGGRCAACGLQTMRDPATRFAHCVACGMTGTPRN